MCEPSTIMASVSAVTSLAIGTASALSKNSQQQADLTSATENANRSLAQSYNATQLKNNQDADKAQSDSFDIVREMAQAKGKASANAGEAGVGGVSFANLMSDYEASTGRAKGNIDYNYASSVQQNQSEAEVNRQKTVSVINNTPKPSQMGMVADIAGQGLKAGLKIYDAFDKPADKPTPPVSRASGTFGSEFDL